MKLTDQELRKLRDAYNVQKKTQGRRKPDRNGHQKWPRKSEQRDKWKLRA